MAEDKYRRTNADPLVAIAFYRVENAEVKGLNAEDKALLFY